MGSNPAAPTIFSFEVKRFFSSAELDRKARFGTERTQTSEVGSDSPEKSPKSVQQLFTGGDRADRCFGTAAGRPGKEGPAATAIAVRASFKNKHQLANLAECELQRANELRYLARAVRRIGYGWRETPEDVASSKT